ncbi:MAG: STAS domain-containing protein [Solirubrobacterales bacterium]|nr:STAS domain-containing protein [Solirubrobacterales bacterium]
MRRTFDDPTLGGSLRPRGPIRLALTTWREAGVTVVAVTGELDILTAPKLATRLDDLIRRDQGDVVIELSDAGFIDSLGLHALLNAQRRLSRQSRSLAVVCGPGPVRHSIELARLDDALGLTSSFAEYQRKRSPDSG